jgi:large subunit ribosomal protein L15
LRLDKLARIEAQVIDLATLKSAGLVPAKTRRVKIIASGIIDKPVSVKGIPVTKGARAAIEAAGGTIESPEPRQTSTEVK